MDLVLGRRRISFSLGSETMVTVLVCLVWASPLVGYTKGIVNRLPLLGDYSEWVLAAVYVIPMLLALPTLVKKFCLADYLFFFACVFYYLWNYVAYPENTFFLSENAYLCFGSVFPCYFIGRLIDMDEQSPAESDQRESQHKSGVSLFNLFLWLSVACILMDLFYFLVYAPANKDMAVVAGDDNMHRAYLSLPHVMMLLWATLREFRLWKLVMTILGVLFLLSCGTRGPLVCLGFFGFIYFLFFMNFQGAIYVKSAIVTLVVLIVAFIREIALFLAQTFLNLNLSTRIMEKIVFGDLGNDTYRGDLREILYGVLERGDYFFGIGLFGSGNYGIVYPHFLPLDFFCTWGYAVGSLLLLALALLVTIAFCWARGTIVRTFILLLFSVSIIKLMFSSSFVFSPHFFMLIGMCVSEVLFKGIPNTHHPTPNT